MLDTYVGIIPYTECCAELTSMQLLYQTLLALPPGNVSSVNATYTYATNRIVAL